MQHKAAVDFGGEIALRGYDLSEAALKPGGALKLTLYWQASGKPKRDYTVFTHLLDASNKVVAQQDGRPARGESPTLRWATGQVVRDEYSLQLPEGLASGNLTIEVGLYDASSGERLRIVGGDDRVILGTLPISGR
jgi:hypothetical protein